MAESANFDKLSFFPRTRSGDASPAAFLSITEGERRGSTPEHWASHTERCPDTNPQMLVRAQGAPLGAVSVLVLIYLKCRRALAKCDLHSCFVNALIEDVIHELRDLSLFPLLWDLACFRPVFRVKGYCNELFRTASISHQLC